MWKLGETIPVSISLVSFILSNNHHLSIFVRSVNLYPEFLFMQHSGNIHIGFLSLSGKVSMNELDSVVLWRIPFNLQK